MRGIAAGACLLTAAFLYCPATVQAQLPSADQPWMPSPPTAKPRSPLPNSFDFSLPGEQDWLASVNSASDGPAPVAEIASEPSDCIEPWQIFHRQQVEMQILTGVLYHKVGFGPTGASPLWLLPQLVRVGYMLNSPNPERRFRGSWEAILEMHTAPIVSGPGNIILGGALYGRYNFSCRTRRLVPYLELGGGGVWSDSYLFPPSNLSQGFSFILHVGAGVHYLLNNRWALSAEADWNHYSNAGMTLPNFGINAAGCAFGLTRFLR